MYNAYSNTVDNPPVSDEWILAEVDKRDLGDKVRSNERSKANLKLAEIVAQINEMLPGMRAICDEYGCRLYIGDSSYGPGRITPKFTKEVQAAGRGLLDSMKAYALNDSAENLASEFGLTFTIDVANDGCGGTYYGDGGGWNRSDASC